MDLGLGFSLGIMGGSIILQASIKNLALATLHRLTTRTLALAASHSLQLCYLSTSVYKASITDIHQTLIHHLLHSILYSLLLFCLHWWCRRGSSDSRCSKSNSRNKGRSSCRQRGSSSCRRSSF